MLSARAVSSLSRWPEEVSKLQLFFKVVIFESESVFM